MNAVRMMVSKYVRSPMSKARRAGATPNEIYPYMLGEPAESREKRETYKVSQAV